MAKLFLIFTDFGSVVRPFDLVAPKMESHDQNYHDHRDGCRGLVFDDHGFANGREYFEILWHGGDQSILALGPRGAWARALKPFRLQKACFLRVFC